MFGSKLKTWMENHIGRPKRKTQEKDKGNSNGRGIILESSESLAQSDTGISSGSQQVLSSDNKDGYCTTTMESEKSGMSHCHTAISLPSPESAYSTGYSTDGASPGGTGPPEYYINIRTGKHYFPSPAPTPTSPQPATAFTNFFPKADSTLPSTHLRYDRPASSHPSTLVPGPPTKSIITERKQSAPSPYHFNFSKSPCKKSQLSSLKLFLKSPKQDKGKPKPDVNKTPVLEKKKKILSPEKNKKWYKQPFQKFGQRRIDPTEETNFKNEIKKDIYLDRNLSYLLPKESAASPRQRNRIRTNPWLPTEPMSSQNFHSLQINFSPSLARNRSCTNTPLQNRKTNEMETIQSRIKQINVKYEESKDYLNNLEKAVNRHLGQKLYLELSDHSEEDLTLNEMMGTYNESYVYEKETDILSDSDPTDCEDYVSDSEADNGGDEQDSHDDELDFIDNGSITESDDNFPGNTGKCTYHDVYVKKNSFLFKNERHHSRKGSDCRKSFRREQDSKGRRRRPARKSFKSEDAKEEEKRRVEPKSNKKVELNENVGGLNLSRVLMQRMIDKKGSKSAEGTPVTARRLQLMTELRETRIANDQPKKQPNDLLLIDPEADRRYSELIMEAENIFESLQNSPVIQNRKKLNVADNGRKLNEESVEIWRKAETMCCPGTPIKETEGTPRKSPKNLGLKLSVDETPKKLKAFDFGSNKKNSFKAKSSAHSPLDPLGPTFRNFTVFKPTNMDSWKISSSSSEDSEPFKTKPPPRENECGVLGSPIVPIAFQSVDLGKPLTSYCPQSEPVKRKIYSCSKTYDKLVKQFEKNPIFEESKNEKSRHGSLMVKRRQDGEIPRARPLKVQSERSKEPPMVNGGYVYNGVSYSPRFSPRRSSMPNSVAGSKLSQGHSIDSDVFR